MVIFKVETIELVEQDFSEALRNYYMANKIKLKAEKEAKKFKEILDSCMRNLPVDTLGHSHFISEGFKATRHCIGKVKGFNEYAEAFLKAKGVYRHFLKPSYDKDKIDDLIDTGIATQEEIAKIVDIVPTYRTLVSEVKDGEHFEYSENEEN